MKPGIKKLADELEKVLHGAYEETPTIEEAEKMASRFLEISLILAREMSVVDLDARMKKAGAKRVRAAVYVAAATATEKKPTEAMLSAQVEQDKLVETEQTALDTAEVDREYIQNLFNICHEGHVYMRLLAKGGGV